MSNQSPTANGRGQEPDEPFNKNSQTDDENEETPNKGHGPLKGTDTSRQLTPTKFREKRGNAPRCDVNGADAPMSCAAGGTGAD